MDNHSGSYGTSWADQWDYGSDPQPTSISGGNSKKNAGLEKTKEVAATGVKKVKQGTSVGVRWIKDKYSTIKSRKH